MTTTTILEKTCYAPVFFREGRYSDTPDRVTLLVRHFKVVEGRTGKRRVRIEHDAKVWPTEDAMASDLLRLRRRGWTELPDEADGNPRFVPDAVAAALNQKGPS